MRAVRPVTKPRDTAYIVYTSGPKDIFRFLGLIDTTSEAHGRMRLVQITLIILQQSDRQKLYWPRGERVPVVDFQTRDFSTFDCTTKEMNVICKVSFPSFQSTSKMLQVSINQKR